MDKLQRCLYGLRQSENVTLLGCEYASSKGALILNRLRCVIRQLPSSVSLTFERDVKLDVKHNPASLQRRLMLAGDGIIETIRMFETNSTNTRSYNVALLCTKMLHEIA